MGIGPTDVKTRIPTAPPRPEESPTSDKMKQRKEAVHDALHCFEVLTYCWCMCSRCWRKNGFIGRCVCPDCPCGARGITR
jgi:hypothetical protein